VQAALLDKLYFTPEKRLSKCKGRIVAWVEWNNEIAAGNPININRKNKLIL